MNSLSQDSPFLWARLLDINSGMFGLIAEEMDEDIFYGEWDDIFYFIAYGNDPIKRSSYV